VFQIFHCHDFLLRYIDFMLRLKLSSFLRLGDAYHAGASVFGDGVALQPHTHNFHEVFWVSKGTGLYRCNGVLTPVGPGYLAFIIPRDAHGIDAERGTLSLRNIAFPRRSADLILSSMGPRETARLFHRDSLAGSVQVSPPLLERLNTVFDEMAVLPRTEVRLHAFLFDLVNRLVTESKTEPPCATPPPWLARAVAALREAPNGEKGLADFYRACGRCQEHVARKCRKHYNHTPSELLNLHRLRKAASLLTTTDETILGVSMECGWNNLGHFYNLFKKAYGVTPKHFRHEARRTLPC